MPDAVVRTTAAGFGVPLRRLADAEGVARAPMSAVGPELIEIQRRQIDREFRGEFFFAPGGGRVPWPPSRPFGRRPAPRQRLGGPSGRYARAWQGGAGGSQRVTARTMSLSVSLPGIVMHRGGAQARPRVRQVTRVRARRMSANGRDSAMRIYIGLTFGAWISDATLRGEGLGIPASPHAARHPEGVRLMLEAVDRRFEDL